jgi:predicted extracellular nuclease
MKWILFLLFLFTTSFAQTRNKQFKICIAAFYNLENFYDTVDNKMVNDDDFTINGVKRYSGKIYRDKIDRLSKVIAEIGIDKTKDGAAFFGVAEIENDTVLTDLLHHPLLKKRNYQFVHYDSKDLRGIDVAFIYNPNYFKVENSEAIHLKLPTNNKVKLETRDILFVKGYLDGELIYVLVNHWPSKRGGEDLTTASRNAAAAACRKEIDRIQLLDPKAKIIVMGDLNDNPDSYSVTKILESTADRNKMKPGALFNPFTKVYQQGYGSLANQDTWSLFDQILMSAEWLNSEQAGFYFYQEAIFKKMYMIENRGRYKGYPMRTWDGNIYRGGYSDHFPTLIILLKNINYLK